MKSDKLNFNKKKSIASNNYYIFDQLNRQNIRFKLREYDGGSLVDDELQNKIFPITGDKMMLVTNLKVIPKGWGDGWLEGSEQELYVDIEVLETEDHYKSTTINVDSAAMRVMEVDGSNKKVVVEEPKKEKKVKEGKKGYVHKSRIKSE